MAPVGPRTIKPSKAVRIKCGDCHSQPPPSTFHLRSSLHSAPNAMEIIHENMCASGIGLRGNDNITKQYLK